jgi:hypothetical protein
MRRAGFTATVLGLVAPLFAADDPFAGLNLETHGFASFGYLKSWGNNWHGYTLDGTDEFWEAAANVIARPMDHLRLGAQLFVRDLGEYGNGKVELDWAYADWRADDALGVQVGRVKIPYQIYSESVDIDAARAAVFMPRMYPTRAREILLSTDGAKFYGSYDQIDWAVYGGQRQLQTDGDFASYIAYYFRLSDITSIDADFLTGAQVRWQTPVDGLTTNLAGLLLHGVELSGTSELAPLHIGLSIPDWYGVTAGMLYETGSFTWAAEYLHYYAPHTTTRTPLAGGPSITVDDVYRLEVAYLSCTWHARRWLDCYGAVEGAWDDPTDRHGSPYTQSIVAALCVNPTDHWLVKAEYRYSHGINDVDARLNPEGIAMDWQVFALKTTVDF